MKESTIIRLSDGKRVWLAYGDTGAPLEELPFSCHLNRGGYISLSHKQRRAAVFSEEVFSVEGERYYFGPHPLPQQPIRPSRMSWVQAEGDPAQPQLGLLRVQAWLGIAMLLISCCKNRLAGSRSAVGPLSPILASRWTALFVLSALAQPLGAHAPGPTRDDSALGARMTALHKELEEVRSVADQTFATTRAQEIAGPQASTKAAQLSVAPTPKSSSATSHRPADCALSQTALQLLSPSELYNWHKRCHSIAREVAR